MRDYSKLSHDELIALCKEQEAEIKRYDEALNKADQTNVKLNRTVLSYWRRIEALQRKEGLREIA